MSHVYGSEYRGAVWRDVDFKVGRKLLIAFYPTSLGDRQTLTTVDKYCLVVSDTRLFPSIRNAVSKHVLYQSNAEEILDAPKLLDSQTDSVFLGYLFYSLRVTGGLRDHTDIDAIVLSQLIGDNHISEGGWRFLEAPLIRAMSNADYPVSEATSSRVTETLVTAGCSENLSLARSALLVLMTLSETNRIDMKPFLTQRRRQKLLNNYKALLNSMDVQGQAAFESQINLEGIKLR